MKQKMSDMVRKFFIFRLLMIIIAAMREKQALGFPTSSDTNRPEHSLKKARSFKFGIQVVEELYYL